MSFTELEADNVKSLPEHMFVSNPANTDELVFIVKFNVTILSQPFDAVNVWLYVPVDECATIPN